MRRLAAASCAALLVLAAPASASSDAAFEGDCSWTWVAEPTHTAAGEAFVTTLYATFAVYSASTAQPVGAVVTCTYYFGSEDSSYPGDFQVETLVAGGTGVVTGHRQATVRGDVSPYEVWTCVTVDYDDDTPTASSCSVKTSEGRPFGPVLDVVDGVVDETPLLDAAVCDTLRQAGPAGGPGVLVNSHGDVYVGKHRYWTC